MVDLSGRIIRHRHELKHARRNRIGGAVEVAGHGDSGGGGVGMLSRELEGVVRISLEEEKKGGARAEGELGAPTVSVSSSLSLFLLSLSPLLCVRVFAIVVVPPSVFSPGILI
jgi:hypothetical protein